MSKKKTLKKLEKEAEMIHSASKVMIKENGSLIPALMVVFNKKVKMPDGNTGERMGIFINWTNRGEKDVMAKQLGRMISSLSEHISCLVFSADTFYSKHSKKEVEKVGGEDKVRLPSEDPNRKEMVLTSAFTPDLKEVYSIMQPYVRDGKKVLLRRPRKGSDFEGMAYSILEKFTGLYGN